MDKYRLRCTTDNKYEEVIASAAPTVCPTNAAHTIDSSSIVICEFDIKCNDGTLKELSLAEYKSLRYHEIDLRTEELIKLGFTYDSKTFSLSEQAQTNWLGIKSMEALLTWPVAITTINDEEYSLTEANLNSFAGTGLGTKQAHLDSGRALKLSVNAATDEAGVDAVVDTR